MVIERLGTVEDRNCELKIDAQILEIFHAAIQIACFDGFNETAHESDWNTSEATKRAVTLATYLWNETLRQVCPDRLK